ncbi:hypothetical protein SAMN05216404_105217 [Nitrosospira multiformis]|uniref:Uncharacterized protein n=1 Tax=Nitrosospira multiformis TaxID=1231 RepID=A0A1H8HRV2_9PROT|nr:hypothetical protein SAMN05216404_105217 [Nitrosospira multiformis]
MFFMSLRLMAKWPLLRHLLLPRSIRPKHGAPVTPLPRCKIPHAFIITSSWYDSASTGIRHKPGLNC